jgi:cleavage stimulation factor subunit 2
MAIPQHRCVFVGNIPYDATEEQLIQICEEVGPVVSFRLVIDRETGKPKGYGFCEYKDEETALSARRNLQGYEINGRQLRVDFAENDKNTDKGRDQGRGGPGMAGNTDSQKQIGGPAVNLDSGLNQPFGIPVAMAAAAVMAGALGGAQSTTNSFTENNGFQSQPPVVGSDLLTLHMAKMSRNQLNEILSDIKVMATQNKEQARQILLSTPQLPKAIFQAQIMLGMVSPQMLQMPNIRQASAPVAPALLPASQPGQLPGVQNFIGRPPVTQNKAHFLSNQQPQAGPSNPMVHNQNSGPSHFSHQPPRSQNPVLQQAPGPSVSVRPPPMHSQKSENLTVRQPSSVPAQQPNISNRPPSKDQRFQPSTSMNKNPERIPPVSNNNPTWPRIVDSSQTVPLVIPKKENARVDSSQTVPLLIPKKENTRADSGQTVPLLIPKKENINRENPDPIIHRPSKMVKLEDGKIGSTSSHPSTSQPASAPNTEKQVTQLAPDVEAALLEQVRNLTPEQLSSLPPEQKQQVIMLQQMLRQPN